MRRGGGIPGITVALGFVWLASCGTDSGSLAAPAVRGESRAVAPEEIIPIGSCRDGRCSVL